MLQSGRGTGDSAEWPGTLLHPPHQLAFRPLGKNFVETMLALAGSKEEIRIVADQVGSPTLTDDLTCAMFRLLKTDRCELYHF